MIRINGASSPWHGEDLAATISCGADYLVLPRVDEVQALHNLVSVSTTKVVAMVETARGVLNASSIASGAAGLIAGTNDLAADLGLPDGAGRAPLQTALQLIVLAARGHGIPAFDGVHNGLEDGAAMEAEAREGRMLGFTGKTLIHPRQIAPTHIAFAPSKSDLSRARRLVEAYSGGAERFEGAMIERMHLAAAKRLIERAES